MPEKRIRITDTDKNHGSLYSALAFVTSLKRNT